MFLSPFWTLIAILHCLAHQDKMKFQLVFIFELGTMKGSCFQANSSSLQVASSCILVMERLNSASIIQKRHRVTSLQVTESKWFLYENYCLEIFLFRFKMQDYENHVESLLSPRNGRKRHAGWNEYRTILLAFKIIFALVTSWVCHSTSSMTHPWIPLGTVQLEKRT